MKKDKFNSKFRTYVSDNISPTETDRKFVSDIYDSFKTILNQSCIQIGSYPRFTAIRPLHDLDILYILGNWNEQNHSPQELLEELLLKIENEYSNPANYKIEILLQTHSVTVVFRNDDEEIFSVDIVPAYIFSQNEFKQDTYKVPEVIREKHGKNRIEFYKKLTQEHKEMDWVKTDPRGYIEMAKKINQTNDDFRKTVKFIKAWKNSCENKYENFKFKSFHIEQVIVRYFQEKTDLEIFDSIFKFFVEIPNIIELPKIKDRINNDKYIDEYLRELTDEQRKKIIQAKDCFLIKLEKFLEGDDIKDLLNVCFYKRCSDEEQFLFDFNIPTLSEPNRLKIDGFILKKDGFRDGWLSMVNQNIAKDRKIKFSIKKDINKNYTMWKVQNDKLSDEILSASVVRGEITKNQTLNNYERTLYKSNSYVECYAIKDDICIDKSKINVIIK